MTVKQRRAHQQRRRATTIVDSPPSFAQALACFQRGDLPAAAHQLQQLLADQPHHADALHLTGVVLFQAGQLEEAVRRMKAAIAEAPNNAAMRSNFGLVLHEQGQLTEAAGQYRHALVLQPKFAEAHNNLGNTLQLQGLLEEAQASYQTALALKPDYVDARINLGTVLNAQGKPLEAIEQYQLALALDPRSARSHYNLGNALLALDREDEAWAHFQQTLQLDPRDRNARINLGNICHLRHRLPEALSWYDAALTLDSEEPQAHFHKSMVHLLTADYTAGWPHYEYRHLAATKAPGRTFPAPLWRGGPLAGRRILLHCEQGLGDTLQFLRYVHLVQATGGQPILLVQPSLRTLVAHSFPKTEVVQEEKNFPAFDLHCPFPSLPLCFQTSVDSIPATVPYLTVPEPERALAIAFPWPASGLRVGLVLSGNPEHKRDRYRSMSAEASKTILEVKGVHFFSLHPCAPSGTTDLHLALDNLAATAAKMLQLDLVITVDTMAAHLAGALGLPTWVLLDHSPDWRWMLDRPDSPWYPTALLFRQTTRGDWATVAGAAAHALAGLRDRHTTHRLLKVLPTG